VRPQAIRPRVTRQGPCDDVAAEHGEVGRSVRPCRCEGSSALRAAPEATSRSRSERAGAAPRGVARNVKAGSRCSRRAPLPRRAVSRASTIKRWKLERMPHIRARRRKILSCAFSAVTHMLASSVRATGGGRTARRAVGKSRAAGLASSGRAARSARPHLRDDAVGLLRQVRHAHGRDGEDRVGARVRAAAMSRRSAICDHKQASAAVPAVRFQWSTYHPLRGVPAPARRTERPQRFAQRRARTSRARQRPLPRQSLRDGNAPEWICRRRERRAESVSARASKRRAGANGRRARVGRGGGSLIARKLYLDRPRSKPTLTPRQIDQNWPDQCQMMRRAPHPLGTGEAWHRTIPPGKSLCLSRAELPRTWLGRHSVDLRLTVQPTAKLGIEDRQG